MDLSDEDFYDSDQSDAGNQSLRAMLKKTLYDQDDDEYNEYGEQNVDELEALGSIQEEVLGKITDNIEEEVVLGPINSGEEEKEEKEDQEEIEETNVGIAKKLDEAEAVVLAPELLGELEKKHLFDSLDNDDFEPLKKKPKVSHNDKNPQNTIAMHVPQFIRCNKSGQSIQVQNIVCGANMGCKLDLVRIVLWTSNSEYNPRRFNGLIMRLRQPNITSLLFPSGKIIMQGAKDDRIGNLGCRKVARILERLGHDVKFSDYTVHNIVCTWDVGFPIMLEDLNTAHAQFTSFEPEVFPALVYRMVRPRAVFLMFVNGKIVITGLKTKSDIKESVFLMHEVLQHFRKT